MEFCRVCGAPINEKNTRTCSICKHNVCKSCATVKNGYTICKHCQTVIDSKITIDTTPIYIPTVQ